MTWDGRDLLPRFNLDQSFCHAIMMLRPEWRLQPFLLCNFAQQQAAFLLKATSSNDSRRIQSAVTCKHATNVGSFLDATSSC
jgi:hypothetical protein